MYRESDALSREMQKQWSDWGMNSVACKCDAFEENEIDMEDKRETERYLYEAPKWNAARCAVMMNGGFVVKCDLVYGLTISNCYLHVCGPKTQNPNTNEMQWVIRAGCGSDYSSWSGIEGIKRRETQQVYVVH